MSTHKRLWLLVLRDVLSFGVIIALFEIRSPWGPLAGIGLAFFVTGYLQKHIQAEGDGPLEGAQRHIYFACESALFFTLIALILLWISRHPVPAARGLGAFAILSLFGLLCWSFIKLYPRFPKV